MRLHDPVRGAQDVEVEGVQDQVRAEPHEPVVALFEGGPEVVRVGAPGEAVDPVGGHHEVVLGRQFRRGRGLGAGEDPYAEFGTTGAQDPEEPLPADRGETVSPRRGDGAVDVDVDVVPARELPGHLPVDPRVGVLDPAEGLVGEHHAEPEGVVGGVAFVDGDLVPHAEPPGQGREVESGGASADTRDAHRSALPVVDVPSEVLGNGVSSRSRNRWSLPVAVLGRAGTKTTERGAL